MASFADYFTGQAGVPFGGGGDSEGYPGLMGSRNAMVGMGLGLLSGGGQGFPNAMKGYESGAAIDSRSADRRAAMIQQARERALQRDMQRERMGQQQSQWQKGFDLQKDQFEQSKMPKAHIFAKPGPYDRLGNPTQDFYMFSPEGGGTIRKLDPNQAQGLVGAGVPFANTGSGQPETSPSGGDAQQGFGPSAPVPFADMPESNNVEDRRYGQGGAATAPSSPQEDVADRLARMGVPGSAMKGALQHYGNVQGDAAAGKFTEAQGQARNRATRMEATEGKLQTLDKEGTAILPALAQRYLSKETRGYATMATGGEPYQEYAANKGTWLSAFLRADSGAQINESEWERYDGDLFPQPGDGKKAIETKRELRAAVTEALKQGAGPGYDPAEILAKAKARVKAREGGESGSKGSLSATDRQALDWANANPNDPRAVAIKKKLTDGVR